MENWIEWLFSIESKHEGLIKNITYIFRECGGLFWPVLYGTMLVLTWNKWTIATQIGFLLSGIILTVIAILYPRTWRHWARNTKEPVDRIEQSFKSLVEYFKEDKLDLWQRAREKGIENEVTKDISQISKKLDELKERLIH